MFLFCKDEKKAKDKAYLCFPAPGPQFVQLKSDVITVSTSAAFPGKKVLSPNMTNVIQDQPSSNVQKQPSGML